MRLLLPTNISRPVSTSARLSSISVPSVREPARPLLASRDIHSSKSIIKDRSMKVRHALIIAASQILSLGPAFAAEPIRIGVTTILSGPNADRGQSEQYGIELALQRINAAGGVLGRPIEASYADNAADPAIGVAQAKRLLEEVHVSVLLGALATPVTRALMPIANAAKVPLIIDISAG